MHLAYLDESGTDGYSPIVMYGALIVPVGKFGNLATMHGTAIHQILPVERVDEFQEFHASELYNGTGIFEGIDQLKRFRAIRLLLSAVGLEQLHFVYSAVDRKKFASSPFGTAKLLNTAFHMCLLGIEDWATANHPNRIGIKTVDWKDTYVCILDDCDNRDLKKELRNTYRTLRRQHLVYDKNGVCDVRLWHAHDDVFFADSKTCLGIQIPDLCNYFVRRRLTAEPEQDEFYCLFADRIICAKPEPESTLYRDLFRSHC